MSSRRLAKVAEAIRETVSSTVLFGLKDPRVKNITVLGADVSPDIRNAKIYVSVMGDEKAQTLTMHGLNSARGFIQAKIAERLQTKNTPILTFVLDKGVKISVETSSIIRDAIQDSGTPEQVNLVQNLVQNTAGDAVNVEAEDDQSHLTESLHPGEE